MTIAKKKAKRKSKMIFEDGSVYKKRLREVQALYAPPIVNCSNCGSPRHHMYRCQYCEKE